MGSCSIYRIHGLEPVGLEEVYRGRDLVFFGEVHGLEWIVECERMLLRGLASAGFSWLGLEMFNYRMQGIIDSWMRGDLSWEDLVDSYSRSREGFPLERYRPLLEEARSLGVAIIGVMPPREEASRVSRLGLEYIASVADSPVPPDEVRLDFEGYRDNFLALSPREGPMASLDPEKLLMAQAYKDEVIARIASRVYGRLGRGLVIAGWAHVEYLGGAPSRLEEGISHVVVTSRDVPLREALESVRSLRYGLAEYIAVEGARLY